MAADPREPLGRIFHEQGRLTVNAEREKPFHVGPWEERTDEQREIDMRGGHAVVNYALTENAASWGTSCTSCARVLDSAYAETVRREAAEARLAELLVEVTALRAHALLNGIPLADLERIRDAAITGSEEESRG